MHQKGRGEQGWGRGEEKGEQGWGRGGEEKGEQGWGRGERKRESRGGEGEREVNREGGISSFCVRVAPREEGDKGVGGIKEREGMRPTLVYPCIQITPTFH